MSSILQKQQGQAIAPPITITTTTETLCAYSGRVEANLATLTSIIKGWATITTGAGTTALVFRLRRGNGITGAVVATVTITTAASVTVMDVIKFAEQLLNVEFADYSLTVQQTGAGANGSIVLAMIEVEQING
jgi:hypothetical protein